ncbi:glycosyltransferase [Meiothermus sp.]|uniref:glycosyltransferase n=1 Tax=Meiothermus sp. TaxID=1955249 RepID=UPI0039A0051B
MLRAAARIKAPIVFVGSPNMLDSERKYVGQFEGELESYPGYVKHIKFLSPGSRDLANAYAGAHVHALVSWVETPGLANLEAGINGANLVVGESPPVREYLENCATFVCQQETEKISIALEEALSQKRDSRSQSSFIRNNYSWSRVSSMLVSIYYQTLKGLG